jgi:hypothetical protein
MSLLLRASGTVLEFMQVNDDLLDMAGCWTSVNGKGTGHAVHTDPNNFLSGAYHGLEIRIDVVQRLADSNIDRLVESKITVWRPPVGVSPPRRGSQALANSASNVVRHRWERPACCAQRASEIGLLFECDPPVR